MMRIKKKKFPRRREDAKKRNAKAAVDGVDG
jgi:hypothetical protein